MDTNGGPSNFQKKSVKKVNLKAKYRFKRVSKKIPKPLPVPFGFEEIISSSVQVPQADTTSEQESAIPVARIFIQSGTRIMEIPEKDVKVVQIMEYQYRGISARAKKMYSRLPREQPARRAAIIQITGLLNYLLVLYRELHKWRAQQIVSFIDSNIKAS